MPMTLRFWPILAAAALLGVAGAARADTCSVAIGNGTDDILVSVTVRAEFAPPGSTADQNLPLPLAKPLTRNQSQRVEWNCTTNAISYVATGTFANAVKRRSAPFTPKPNLSGVVETAWIE